MSYAFDELFNELTSNFENLYADARYGYSLPFPPTNQLMDENKNLILQFALAGYAPEDINVQHVGDVITISGKGSEEKEANLKIIHQKIKKASFERKYALPTGKYELAKAVAEFKNGLLTITIPAAESSQPKPLKIKF